MTNYAVDTAHSEISFTVRHMMFAKVRGHFTAWNAKLSYDSTDPSKASVQAEIDVASIDTRDEKRDGHLRSDDFFSAEKFPKMIFKSRSIERAGKNYKVSGDSTDPRRHEAHHARSRGDGQREDSMGQPAPRVHGAWLPQSHGLGPQVEPGARGGRRPREREGRHRNRKCRRSSRSSGATLIEE